MELVTREEKTITAAGIAFPGSGFQVQMKLPCMICSYLHAVPLILCSVHQFEHEGLDHLTRRHASIASHGGLRTVLVPYHVSTKHKDGTMLHWSSGDKPTSQPPNDTIGIHSEYDQVPRTNTFSHSLETV